MKKYLITAFLLFFLLPCYSQDSWNSQNVFGADCFIENSGQFDALIPEVSNINFAYIHGNQEIYITEEGFTLLLSSIEIEEQFKNLNPEELKEEKKHFEIYKKKSDYPSLRWMNQNKNSAWIGLDKTDHYFTYGKASLNSFGYKKIRKKNLYNGIDVLYEIHPNGGIEYTLELNSGADITDIQFEYTGAKNVYLKDKHQIVIENEVDNISERFLKAYYENGENVELFYELNNGKISFASNQQIDPSRKLIIDPWVTANTTLTGLINANGGENKAYDVDYDIDGNLFVIGGGGETASAPNAYPKIAKYDPTGVLLWTFSGVIPAIPWNSSPGTSNYARVGNLVVDKLNGKSYMSQGLHVFNGAQIIRLDPAGNYDNFATVQDPDFLEIWEMKFNCGSGEVVGMGGGTSSNINYGIIDTLTGVVTISNATNEPAIAQDLVCTALGPSDAVYSIFSSGSNVRNKIYRVTQNYTNNMWNTPCGYSVFTEQGNKPHVNTSAFSNGYNALAANSKHLFYFDSWHLKAFDISNGNTIGVWGDSSQTLLSYGGVYVNECDEVYTGGPNGNLLKYSFDGSTFTPLGSLTIGGIATNSVYDLVYNPINDFFYVCGDQFVARLSDDNSICSQGSGGIDLTVSYNCSDSATVNIVNPDPTLNYTFIWCDSTTGTEIRRFDGPIGINSDLISGLSKNVAYKVTVLHKQACQVSSGTAYFTLESDDFYSSSSYTICPDSSIQLPDGSFVNQSGNYLNAFTTTGGCDSIYETTVLVDENLCPCKLYISNAFSPNGDNNNDLFKPIINCDSEFDQYEMSIFNRWGQRLFLTNDRDEGWDGFFQGEEQLGSTYFYLIKYKIAFRERLYERRGDLTLIR